MADSEEASAICGEIPPKRGQRGRPSVERVAAIDADILAAAAELFLKNGYGGTSMDAVAERVGIPRTTLYRRYSDKSALLTAVLERRRAAWADAVSGHADPTSNILSERLKHHVAITLAWASRDEIRAFLKITASALRDTDGKFQRNEAFGFNIMIERIASDIVRFGPKQGYQANEPADVAFALMAMIAGWIELRTVHTPLSTNEISEAANYIVELITNGRSSW